MGLLNMTNRAKIHQFYKKVTYCETVIFYDNIFKFGDLSRGMKVCKNAKFQHNIPLNYAYYIK